MHRRVAPTYNYNFQMSYCRTSSGECVNGAFSAYGKGPSKIKVTGGIDDLFAATGQVNRNLTSTFESVFVTAIDSCLF